MAETAYFGESLKSGSGMLAAADLSTKQFHAVTIGSGGVSLVAAAGTGGVKVLTNKPIQGDVCALVDVGETKMIAGGVIVKGALLMTDSSGRFVTFVDAGGQVPVGEARMAAGAANDIITGFIFPGGNWSGAPSGSASGALTAAGTDRATALALTSDVNHVGTTGSGTGVTLPAAALGAVVWIGNAGAQTLAVYAAGSDSINGTAGSTGVTMATTKNAAFFCGAAGLWRMVLTA